MLLRTTSHLLVALLLLSAMNAFAWSTDPRLLQLVPPQSHLVAGMSHTTAQGTTGSFLVLTRENKIDLSDFFALTGRDASRRLSAMVFVAVSEPGGNQHSLLVSGQFNRESIFRFGAAGSLRESYRAVPVLVVPPFERERGTMHETRWLAILDGQIAVFGSIESVRSEIDRWLDQSATDPVVLHLYRGLEGNDDSWCLMLAWDRFRVAERALEKLDPKLRIAADDPGMLSWGIKFGRKIAIVTAIESFPRSPEDLERAERATPVHAFSLLPSEPGSNRATVKVSRRKYEQWMLQSAPPDPLLPGR